MGDSPPPIAGPLLDEFCAEAGSGPRTEIIELLLNGFASYGHENAGEAAFAPVAAEWEREDGDPAGAVAQLPVEAVLAWMPEFLSWFLISKVMGGPGFREEAAAVCGELVAWLRERGALDPESANALQLAAEHYGEVLPRAERLERALHELTRIPSGEEPPRFDPGEVVSDRLAVERVEAGRIWFAGGVGPFRLPERIATDTEPGWEVSIEAVPVGGEWRLLECGFVYP